MARPVRLCIIMNHPRTLDVLHRNQFEYLQSHGFEVFGIAPHGKEHEHLHQRNVKTWALDMERNPSPWKDLQALIRLWFFLLFNRFDIIHVSTPKAGLLGSLAAFFSGHFKIVYTIRGRAYENMTGKKRKLMAALETLVCTLSRSVLCISRELREAVIHEGICDPEKIAVIGSGSSNGIDCNHFQKNAEIESEALRLRESLGLKPDSKVILNIGRLTKDKGIEELVEVFGQLNDKEDVHLVLVGIFEKDSPLSAETYERIESHPRIHVVKWMKDVRPAFVMADVMAFPTHREGFGNVALEASAMECPVVAFDVVGVRESVANGVSGMLVPFGDVSGFRKALQTILDDRALARNLAVCGRQRAVENFAQPVIWEGLIAVYTKLMGRS